NAAAAARRVAAPSLWTRFDQQRDNATASTAGAAVVSPPPLPRSTQFRAMADDDFDLAALAAYLHMMPAQVSRLAERGNLPGRRIGGAWRFSRPEISQWLEQRIGLSDDGELAAMETNLERTDVAGAGDVEIAAML